MAEFSFQNATLKMVIIGEDGIARTAFLREADDQIVTGPASAVNGHLAVFDGTSGQRLRDGGAVPGGGGITPKIIDLGLVTMADLISANGILELIPYTEGRFVKSVSFIPTGFKSFLPQFILSFATPNSISGNNGRNGLAYIQTSEYGSDIIFDTLGLVKNVFATAMIGGATPLVPGDTNIILDSTPLAFVFGGGLGGGVPVLQTWAPNTAYPLNVAVIGDDHFQICTTNGTSGVSEPSWDTSGSTTNDGTAVWTDYDPLTGDGADGAIHAYAEVIDLPDSFVQVPTSIEFVQQPTDADAEAIISPAITVRMLDQNGDPYVLQPMQIWLAIVGSGTLNGSYVKSTSMTNGIATFDDLTITEPGNDYILSAQSLETFGVPWVNSAPFDVTAP